MSVPGGEESGVILPDWTLKALKSRPMPVKLCSEQQWPEEDEKDKVMSTRWSSDLSKTRSWDPRNNIG